MTLLEAKQLRVNFAAHSNTTLGAIAETDPTYLGWLIGQTWLDFHAREAVTLLCEHYEIPTKAAAPKADPNQGELFI